MNNSKSKYTWLLFDADGTLFDYEIAERNAIQKTCKDYQILFNSEKHEKYQEINKKLFLEYEKDKIAIDELKIKRFKIWANELGLAIDLDSFPRDYLKNLSGETTLLPKVLNTIEKLSKHYQMAIITNGIAEVQRPRLEKSEIYKYFKYLIISDEIGVSKPNPEYFEFVMNKIKNPLKNQVLVIGDGLSSDILGGNNFGLDTCWLNRSKIKIKSMIIPTYTIGEFDQLLDILV